MSDVQFVVMCIFGGSIVTNLFFISHHLYVISLHLEARRSNARR